jgi:hypothetical protein
MLVPGTRNNRINKGNTLYVGVWKKRLREKWNMVKIDDPNEAPKNWTSRQAFVR